MLACVPASNARLPTRRQPSFDEGTLALAATRAQPFPATPDCVLYLPRLFRGTVAERTCPRDDGPAGPLRRRVDPSHGDVGPPISAVVPPRHAFAPRDCCLEWPERGKRPVIRPLLCTVPKKRGREMMLHEIACSIRMIAESSSPIESSLLFYFLEAPFRYSICRRRLVFARHRQSRKNQRQESPPTGAISTQLERLTRLGLSRGRVSSDGIQPLRDV